MLINNELFYPGNVIYNAFNIDFDKPYIAQLTELNEDLIQVEYNDNYLLDIGWYPEGDENGKMIIQLIHINQWDKPIIREEINNIDELFKNINKILAFIKLATEK